MITGIECSCIMYVGYPHQASSMCLKHEKDIFGAEKVKTRLLKPKKRWVRK